MPDGDWPSRAAIVSAAADVFAERGFATTTVQDLLRAADVSRRTFYKSFANKEAVLAAIYDERSERLLAALREANRSGPVLDALRAGLHLYLDHHARSGPLLLVLIEEAGRSGSMLAERRKAVRAELDDLIGGAVERTHGERPDPLLVIAMLSALEGLSLHILRNGVTKKELSRAKDVMTLMLEKLLAP